MTTAELRLAAERLEDVLSSVKSSAGSHYQFVIERNGRLWAIAVTEAFDGMSACNRQEKIWGHLNKNASADDLLLLDAVTCYTINEYSDLEWLVESRRRFSDYVEGPNGTSA